MKTTDLELGFEGQAKTANSNLKTKQTKEERKMKAELEQQVQEAFKQKIVQHVIEDIAKDTYGHYSAVNPIKNSQRAFVNINDIDESLENVNIWVRARLHDIRLPGKKLCFVILRNQLDTLQGIISSNSQCENSEMITFVSNLPNESIIDIYGTITIPQKEIETTTKKVEISIKKCFCVSICSAKLPFLLKDANRPENEKDEIQVLQDTRLDNRIIDLRTFCMQAIVRLTSQVCQLFREALYAKNFTEIHSPKLIGGTSEGGSNVFQLKYFDKDACLAQSPQLHKQMCISSDLDRVFEIGPVFRAENSNTHAHLCEFTGLDFEMAIYENYTEILDMMEYMFLYIFDNLPRRCKAEIETIRKQYPFNDFRATSSKYGKNKIVRITYQEGCEMLRKEGHNIPEDITEFDMNKDQEKALGNLIANKYEVDFYILTDYPLAIRPFYTMPNNDNNLFSNSYDWFMRNEEVLSGAQRIHSVELLKTRATACGINLDTIKNYIDSFSFGAYPHGGCGIGLERVVMLYLNLKNIRKVSMFPRDPKRLAP